jgi:hypothetical protein
MRTSDAYGRHSWEVSCGERAMRSYQLVRYLLTARCALVRMLRDTRGHLRHTTEYATRRRVRYAHFRSEHGRYRANFIAIISRHG